ncbi:MAG: RNA polymerase sigma-70 factor [Tannerella sp.]|jgi:RNA polymerase sigma-70 factor (ECF subfamily)|nr:RNA polymerase sigma-70 factor [Tannerella sp.]
MQNDFIDLKKIKEGDIQTFERVFRYFYPRLYQYAFSITGQREQAEEIIQDTFYVIWKDRKKIQIFHSLQSYLFKSVRNRSLQYLEHLQVRDQYRENMVNQDITTSEPTPEEILEQKELEIILAQTIKRLPARCRQIFHMHRINGKKNREIAENLSISVKTVEAEMTKAYRILRKEVAQYIK